jgi:hypothetical protein
MYLFMASFSNKNTNNVSQGLERGSYVSFDIFCSSLCFFYPKRRYVIISTKLLLGLFKTKMCTSFSRAIYQYFVNMRCAVPTLTSAISTCSRTFKRLSVSSADWIDATLDSLRTFFCWTYVRHSGMCVFPKTFCAT